MGGPIQAGADSDDCGTAGQGVSRCVGADRNHRGDAGQPARRVVVPGKQRFANDNGSKGSPFVNVLRFDRAGKVVCGEFHAGTAKMAKLQG